jgi:hypothetical protein
MGRRGHGCRLSRDGQYPRDGNGMWPFQIHLDPSDDILGCDHVQAPRNSQFGRDLHRLLADLSPVLLVAVTHQLAT